MWEGSGGKEESGMEGRKKEKIGSGVCEGGEKRVGKGR